MLKTLLLSTKDLKIIRFALGVQGMHDDDLYKTIDQLIDDE